MGVHKKAEEEHGARPVPANEATRAGDRRLATLHKNNEESNAFVRECIEEALVQLMAEKPFASITVSDIAARAGVSRNAYYRNYGSKEDILAGYLESLRLDISRPMLEYDPVEQTREVWDALLAAVADHARRYRLLLDAGFGELIRQGMCEGMGAGAPADASPGQLRALRLSNAWWAGAICSVLEEWIRSGMEASAEEVAEVGCALMREGIATARTFGNHCDL